MFDNTLRLTALFILLISLQLCNLQQAHAADDASDVSVICKNVSTLTYLKLNTLGITISNDIPLGTVVASGTATVTAKCGLSSLGDRIDGLTGTVYFKRGTGLTNAEGILGYGLSLYVGYAGNMGLDDAVIATDQTVSTWAITGSTSVENYTIVTLSIPYEIVKTSSSTSGSSLLGTIGTMQPFALGSSSSTIGSGDVKFEVTNIKSAIAVANSTCSAVGDTNQTVTLGTYGLSTSSGFGSGIGTTTPLKGFNVALDCTELSGSFDVLLQFDGTAAVGLSDSGVMALGDSSSATGLGVQLLDSNENAIPLATPFKVAAYPLSSSNIVTQFYARYYQTADKVTGGSANATATYTISYQ
ncbi:MAG: fimbrial protein [Gibbsiella quercinecans]|uniref:fimbrial protein n=1 Tax=Gibbsiella quercinecans TaxID=929813 RepID=UPI003F379775